MSQPISAVHRWSNELWYNVFDIVEYDSVKNVRTHAILPLMLVCKRWKEIATPLLYRSVLFLKPDTFRQFTLHIVSQHAKGRRPSAFIRSLGFAHCEDPEYRCSLIAVTSMATNLASFHGCTTTQQFAALSMTCSKTLLHLNIILDGAEDNAIIFPTLQYFANLRHLTVRGRRTKDLVDCVPLDLPFLLDLNCFDRGRTGYQAIPYFFRGCYPSLRQVWIYEWAQVYVQDLTIFLHDHGVHLTRLNFSFNFRDILLPAGIEGCLSHLRHIGVEVWGSESFVPSGDWYGSLPPSVHHLHICVGTVHGLTGLIRSFETINSWDVSVPFKFIHMEDNMVWSSIIEQWPEMAGQWIRCAQRLKSKGIVLLDGEGLQWALEPVMNI